MLIEAFGLRCDPFMDTADPSFFYETMATANSRRRLLDCLQTGRGMAVVVGPIGAGKTTLFNAAQTALAGDERYLCGLILDPTFESEREFLAAIGASLGFAIDASSTTRSVKEDLKYGLFATTTPPARQAVAFIDEAQLLNHAFFESLRALLNFQLDERKLLSIALSGQMDLAHAIMNQPNLSDRVALWLELRPFSEAECAGLLDHRLRRAGYAAPQSPFDAGALGALWLHSGGLPRRLVTLAREAMELAAERGSRTIRAADVEEALGRAAPVGREATAAPDATAAPGEKRRWWSWWRTAS